MDYREGESCNQFTRLAGSEKLSQASPRASSWSSDRDWIWDRNSGATSPIQQVSWRRISDWPSGVSRILGPGTLQIVIPDFSIEKLSYESIAMLEDSSVVGTIDCTYPLPQGAGDLRLSFNYINEPPDASLSMGCAFWALPMEFAQQLIHVFLLGVPNPIKQTNY